MESPFKPSGPEHWLTIMTCTVCHLTPDESPLYKCHIGHVICYHCFKKIAEYGMPKCTLCKSDHFTVKEVSAEFLRKLKYKPGIGRTRYALHPPSTIRSSSGGLIQPPVMKDQTITLEKLFRLTKEQIAVLFGKPKIRSADSSYLLNKYKYYNIMDNSLKVPEKYTDIPYPPVIQTYRMGNCLTNQPFKVKGLISSLSPKNSQTTLQSKKPLICPHDPCRKIIAISACQTHFKHEHFDLPKYSIERGQQLHLRVDPSVIEFNTTLCLGMVTVYDINRLSVSTQAPPGICNVVKKFNQKNPLDTFWIMISGSPSGSPQNSYVICWLFTDKANNSDFFNCTLDVSSLNDKISYSTYCEVNDLCESQNIIGIAQNLNCLYLTYGCLKSMLKEGPKINLRIVIN